MNLQDIVAGAITAVNPNISIIWQQSQGYQPADDGTQQPQYASPVTLAGNVQAMTAKDIQHLSNLNLQGDMDAVYLPANIQGVERPGTQGGDLLTFNGAVYLVVQVLETWPSWSKVAVQKQMDAAA